MDIISFTPKSIAEAALYGNYNAAVRLLGEGKSANDVCDDNIPAIFHAIRQNDIRMAQLLSEHGADINTSDPHDGISGLMYAVAKNFEDMIDFLLNRKPNLGWRDHQKNTIWHYAAFRGNLSIYKKYENEDRELNAVNSLGKTPLHLAAEENHNHMILYLVKAGAQVNQKTSDGFSPIHYAAKSDAMEALIVLLESDGDIRASDDNGWTALHHAVYHGKKRAMMELLSRDSHLAVINDKWSNSPLHYAVHTSDIEIVRLLLQHGAQINYKNKDGLTALESCEHANSNIKQLLNH